MELQIELTRSELIWQTRKISWTKHDWKNYKDWIKGVIEKSTDTDTYYKEVYGPLYEIIKDMSWKDIVNEFKNPTIEYTVHRTGKTMDGDFCEWDFTTSLHDAIMEAMREDVFEADISEEEYAGDSYEDTAIYGDEE